MINNCKFDINSICVASHFKKETISIFKTYEIIFALIVSTHVLNLIFLS